jgi:hypothetical protein
MVIATQVIVFMDVIVVLDNKMVIVMIASKIFNYYRIFAVHTIKYYKQTFAKVNVHKDILINHIFVLPVLRDVYPAQTLHIISVHLVTLVIH